MSLQERVPSTTVTNEQYHVPAVSKNEQGREEGERHLGVAYVVPYGKVALRYMYESPRQVFEEIKGSAPEPRPDLMELVGADQEQFRRLGRLATGEWPVGLPSVVVRRDDYTPQKQRQLAEEVGIEYGRLVNMLPSDSTNIDNAFEHMEQSPYPSDRLRIVSTGAPEVREKQ